jgi:hypothetical protein
MPGIGTLLGAEFIGLTGGDMDALATPDRLDGVTGPAPAPKDSGRVGGNLHRPRRYSRRLLCVLYMPAQATARCCPVFRTFHDRKRAEGKGHEQAVLALARRRLNVLWALVRNNPTFTAGLPVPEVAAA